jgi:transcriptional regulator GlxA family with amidase domain
MEPATPATQEREPASDLVVRRALSLLGSEPARRWTVASLAKSVGVSRPVLARRFVESTGVSPLRSLTRLRMELAAELLGASDAGLAEIGSQVGYDSEFAFSRAFRRHHGTPPGAFRRSHRVQPSASLSSAV